MLLACLTVDAAMTLRELLDRIANEADSMYVVIRRTESSDTYWYSWKAEDLRLLASRRASEVVDWSLSSALRLHESDADGTYDGAASDDVSHAHGVLLRGNEAVGVLRPDSGTRGRGPTGGRGPTRSASAGRVTDRRPFLAYPKLVAPESVLPKASFDLEVGLSAKPFPGVSGRAVTMTVPPVFKFDLQIIADGFSMPNGSRATLDVQRDRFEEAHASIKLVAPDIPVGECRHSNIEIQFFFEGNLCSRALRAITVSGDTVVAVQPVTTESGTSVSIPDVAAPDLTVLISRGSDDRRLLWTIATREGPPSDPVAHQFDNDSAQSFAFKIVRDLANWDKNSLTSAFLRGIASQVSGAMPKEFWQTLGAVWERKQAAGKPSPSVLIVSDDPYVPWELAATSDEYIDPVRLDATRPPFLGAQLRVGRWIPPDPTPRGGDVPALPPTTETKVDKMVLFIGDYDALEGQRPLPQAIEEGRRLALVYGGIKREAVINDVTELVNDEIVEAGQPVIVDAIHFACHGEVSDNSRHNGIVLSRDTVRLDAYMIAGSEIGKTSDPFVFVNACQLGLASKQLDGDYGGLARAFLDKGATGFVSPLWSVDDDIAQEFALGFYRLAYDMDNPTPVAEVMRELRSRFDMESSRPLASYLAYVYYGHPDLIIEKT